MGDENWSDGLSDPWFAAYWLLIFLAGMVTVVGAFVIVGETFPYKSILLAVLGYCAMMVAAMRLHHRFGDRFVEREW